MNKWRLTRKALPRNYLQRLILALRSRAWQGANFECVCSPSKLEPSLVRSMTTRTDQASSTYCRERLRTTEVELLPTTGRESAGPRIGTPDTGSRTEERSRRWRSRSTSSRLNPKVTDQNVGPEARASRRDQALDLSR